MQTLFHCSEESPGIQGLGIIDGTITKFPRSNLKVPHMGWNGLNPHKSSSLTNNIEIDNKFYFVHSYMALSVPEVKDWVLTTTNYGVEFISSVCKGNVFATQFHPEKSGAAGLALLRNYLLADRNEQQAIPPAMSPIHNPTSLAPRVIACLDVRTNDQGDLVVTKGDQYVFPFPLFQFSYFIDTLLLLLLLLLLA